MEELAKSDESKNGDQVENKETTLEVSEVSSQSSSTIATEDGGKVNPDENKLMEQKPVEPLPSAADTNSPVQDLSKSSTDEEKLIEISAAENAKKSPTAIVTENPPETSVKTDTQELTSQTETGDTCVKESEETLLNQAAEESKDTVGEINSTIVEESAQEKPTTTMDVTAEPAANQAMEVEELLEPEQ
uniref:Uncharacterized protein n=1 Tax=Anopheles maculatus TaxID=74869 RepID=A0A182TCL3_9DIPT